MMEGKLPEPIQGKLPKPIQAQLEEAEHLQRQAEHKASMKPPPGRPKNPIEYKPVPFFVADTEFGLKRAMDMHREAVGPRRPGNKRIGKSALLADLVQYLLTLKRSGVKITVSKQLPKERVTPVLAEILYRHGYIKTLTITDSQRAVIGAELERQLRRAADAVNRKQQKVRRK